MSPRSREKSPCCPKPQPNVNQSGVSETTILVQNLGGALGRGLDEDDDGEAYDGTNSPTLGPHHYLFGSRPSLIRRRNTVQVMEPLMSDEPETCSLGDVDSPRKDIKVMFNISRISKLSRNVSVGRTAGMFTVSF